MHRLHSISKPIPISARRRGGVYLVVLAFSALVTVISLGSIFAARMQSKLVGIDNDILVARHNARAAIEIGRLMIRNDSSWRTNNPNGDWFTNRAMATGSATLNAVNPNGAMNHASTDPVIFTATGVCGSARQKIQVTLYADSSGIDCLNTAVCAAGAIALNDSVIYSYGATIAGNSTVSASGAKIYANVEAVSTISGTNYYGTNTSGANSRTLPDSTTVFNPYIAEGTAISITSIPSGGSYRLLSKCVISPNSNPYGASTNAKGVYVIDCLNQDLTIRDCRIVGTLVILNPGSSSIVTGSVNWEPAVSNYPSLLIKGVIQFFYTGFPLTEDSTATNNFNPAGTPYPYSSGTTDTDYLDSYPSSIKGLIYVSGGVQINGTGRAANLGMLMSGGLLRSFVTQHFQFDSTYYSNPPPGFTSVTMRPQSNAYLRLVD